MPLYRCDIWLCVKNIQFQEYQDNGSECSILSFGHLNLVPAYLWCVNLSINFIRVPPLITGALLELWKKINKSYHEVRKVDLAWSLHSNLRTHQVGTYALSLITLVPFAWRSQNYFHSSLNKTPVYWTATFPQKFTKVFCQVINQSRCCARYF